MQRREPIRQVDSLAFKLAAVLVLLALALSAVAGTGTYLLLNRGLRQQLDRDLRGLALQLQDRLDDEFPDFDDCQAYLYDHRNELFIPLDFDESLTAKMAFGRAFADAFPGKVYGEDVPFSALPEELQQLRAIYCQEAWTLDFERARDSFGLPCAYFLLPESTAGRVAYLVSPKRRGGTIQNGVQSLRICEGMGAPKDTNPLLTVALETGEIQAGRCALDDKYGADYTYIVPMAVEGETLGLVCVGANMGKVRRSAMLGALILAGAVLLAALLGGGVLVMSAKRRYIDRLARLSDHVEAYADTKDASVADAIDREIIGRNEVAMLSHQLSRVIQELRNPFENIENITGELSDTREKAEQLNMLANTDSLTGLGNKMAYNEALAQLEREIAAGTAAFTIVMIDLNFLKRINDYDGHDKGDLALCRLADHVRAAFPNCGKYRIGGDEFVVILKRVASIHAPVLVEAFQKRLEDDPNTEPWLHISAAVGYWTYGQEGVVDVADIFEHADRQMYAHKAAMKAMRVD